LRIALFLGCTVPVRATNYEQAFRRVAAEFGAEVIDVNDFSCCGFPAKAVDRMIPLVMAARNLALAEREGAEAVVTLCNACTETLTETNHVLHHDPEQREKVTEHLATLGVRYDGSMRVWHAARFLYQEIGLERIRQKVSQPLIGWRVAAYPGCHYTKPAEIYQGFDRPERPISLNLLVEATGAETLNLEEACCGGGTLGAKEETALKMAQKTLDQIKQQGADAVTLICPFCDVMFEQNQKKIERQTGVEYSLPVLYYPQLLGLALGIPREELGFSVNRIKMDRLWEKLDAQTVRG
jgi:heterodisulfide reductase subunit B